MWEKTITRQKESLRRNGSDFCPGGRAAEELVLCLGAWEFQVPLYRAPSPKPWGRPTPLAAGGILGHRPRPSACLTPVGPRHWFRIGRVTNTSQWEWALGYLRQRLRKRPPHSHSKLPDISLQQQEASFSPEVGVLWLRMAPTHREARRGHGEDRFLAKFLSTWLQPWRDHPLDILILWVTMFPSFLKPIWVELLAPATEKKLN